MCIPFQFTQNVDVLTNNAMKVLWSAVIYNILIVVVKSQLLRLGVMLRIEAFVRARQVHFSRSCTPGGLLCVRLSRVKISV